MLVRCRVYMTRFPGGQRRHFRTISPSGEVIRDGLPSARGLYDPALEKGKSIIEYSTGSFFSECNPLTLSHLHTAHTTTLHHCHPKDSCGVGFVVDIKGTRSHTVVAQSLEALTNLDHRGAAGTATVWVC